MYIQHTIPIAPRNESEVERYIKKLIIAEYYNETRRTKILKWTDYRYMVLQYVEGQYICYNNFDAESQARDFAIQWTKTGK